MVRTISISQNKGGTLKSSITTNLASVLAKDGYKVLIIDTDSQGNSTLSFGANPDDFKYSIYDVLTDKYMNPNKAIYNAYNNIDVLPSNDDLDLLEFEVLTNLQRYKKPFYLLREKIAYISNEYDFVLVDTPSNLGLIHGNVLSCVQEVIIPFQPEPYSMMSLVKMLKAVNQFRESHNPLLTIAGIIPTLVEKRTKTHRNIIDELKIYCKQNGYNVFNTVIPKSIKYPESIREIGLPLALATNRRMLVKPYYDLKEELLNE